MLKRRFKYSFFSLLLFLVSCAPRVAPPLLYSDVELSLEEVISEAGREIDALKVVVDIDIKKADEPYYHSTASVLIEKPGLLHIRMYNLGMLAGDVIVKNEKVYILSGRINSRFETFIKELYSTIFWWDDVRDGYMYKEEEEYIIRVGNREVYLDSATLLPIKQIVRISEQKLYITYDKPVREGHFWYPSLMEIKMDDYNFTVRIERLLMNPQLSSRDFKMPGED